MTSPEVVGLVVAATALGGVLAGGSLDRAVVQLPAWRRLGAEPWATFSREADLRRGTLLYPIPGLGAPILSLAAATWYVAGGGIPHSAAIPLVAGAILSIGHVLATFRAAPNMLRLRRVRDDQRALEQSLAGFERWHAVRAARQTAAFAANLWSLVTLVSGGG